MLPPGLMATGQQRHLPKNGVNNQVNLIDGVVAEIILEVIAMVFVLSFDILKLLLGACLVMSGFLKLLSAVDVYDVLHAILPRSGEFVKRSISKILPWIELFLGAVWLCPWREELSSYAVCALFGVFCLFLLLLAVLRIDVECRCFGGYFEVGKWKGFVRSLVLFGMSAAVTRFAPLGKRGVPEAVISYLLMGSLILVGMLVIHAGKLRAMRIALEGEQVGG